ncbi:HlyD family secretion protein [Trinickia terrae]|uniref:HlyD family secretion protein n=1 Tax=Trinickia terrae TaxID=2571161 RepID=A0A4U1I3G9_9BURK|nr:HlyD family secretion protein [Trinickia terrae]TKC87791.1 HlyD family secretion protein [Trinickia terrae]
MSTSRTQTEPAFTPAGVARSPAVSLVEPSQPEPSAKAPPNRRVLIIAALFAMAAIGAGGRMWWKSHYFVETDDAYVAGHVHPVSTRIAGVVSAVLIKDNQTVRKGDVIAELDPADQRVKVEQIEAQIGTAEQQVIQADARIAQARAQANGATAQVAQSAAELQRARQDADRYGQLYSTQMKAVSKSEFDAANAKLASATADLSARRDSVSAAQAQIGAEQASRDVIKAQIQVLKAQLKEAQQQLAYNRIVAPVSGRIGKRTIEVGMRVEPGQQLAAIVQEDVWVVANFKETQLEGLRSGQQVEVKVDTMPDKPLIGRIDSFAPGSGAQFALLPPDNATGNFTKIVQRIPVKIVLRPEDIAALDGRLVPGMSALAEVKLSQPEHAKSAS